MNGNVKRIENMNVRQENEIVSEIENGNANENGNGIGIVNVIGNVIENVIENVENAREKKKIKIGRERGLRNNYKESERGSLNLSRNKYATLLPHTSRLVFPPAT